MTVELADASTGPSHTPHTRPSRNHRPDKPLCGLQDAVLRTAERILGGGEGADGEVALPPRCHLRMLLYKYQVGWGCGWLWVFVLSG
jgi:hypothetical protein